MALFGGLEYEIILDLIDGVIGLDIESDGLTSEGLDENLHCLPSNYNNNSMALALSLFYHIPPPYSLLYVVYHTL